MEMKDKINCITAGFSSVSGGVTNMFDSFKSSVKTIVPKLNQQERDQLNNALSRYCKFLMNTQDFISSTRMGVKYAETLQHLCEALPVKLLETLTEDVQSLITDFQNLEFIVNSKLREDKYISDFKNIMIGMSAVGAGLALIGIGVGAVYGVGAVVKGLAIIGGTAAVVGATGAVIADLAMKVSDIGQILKALEDVRKCLVDVGKEQENIKGKNNGLKNIKGRTSEMEMKILNEERKEFQDILDRTQKQVDKGFEILKK